MKIDRRPDFDVGEQAAHAATGKFLSDWFARIGRLYAGVAALPRLHGANHPVAAPALSRRV